MTCLSWSCSALQLGTRLPTAETVDEGLKVVRVLKDYLSRSLAPLSTRVTPSRLSLPVGCGPVRRFVLPTKTFCQ